MKSKRALVQTCLCGIGRLQFKSGTRELFEMPSSHLRYFLAYSMQTQSRRQLRAGVSNGQIAYVGKTGSGRYLPFNFKRTITAFDSEEMFIITKEGAEAYEQAAAQATASKAASAQSSPDAIATSPSVSQPENPTPKASGLHSGPEATQLPLGLSWSGEVPSQKWMNFYTKVLTKLGAGNDLSLNVKVKCKPQAGVSKQKIEEIKSALRELGLDDNLGE